VRRAPATSSPRFRPWSLVPVTVGLLLLALSALGSLQWALTATVPTAATSTVSLVDEDGGSSLFSAARLSPGRIETACVGLTASGSIDPATEVGLSADVTSGALAPYLQVWVERGSVPDGGSCASFSGASIWSGTLAQFPRTGTAGIPTGWQPALAQRSVYRFTVTLLDDPRAQELQAAASFRWSLTEAGPPPVEPTPDPEPVSPPTPGPVAVAAPEATPAAGPTSAAPRSSPPAPAPTAAPSTSAATPASTTAPTPAPTAPTTAAPETSSAPVPVADGGDSEVVEAPPLETGPIAALQAAVAAVAQTVAEVASQVGETAVAVAGDGEFPLALVGVVAAFLFLQGRLDRRDPKLALARVREELSDYREFPEPPPTETT
jgi:hypothetical protein